MGGRFASEDEIRKAEGAARRTHCEGCGRAMVPRQEKQGFHPDGTPRIANLLVCPRFDRSWRNLWFGGWSHRGIDLDRGLLEMRWM